jgi:hypothetical protein
MADPGSGVRPSAQGHSQVATCDMDFLHLGRINIHPGTPLETRQRPLPLTRQVPIYDSATITGPTCVTLGQRHLAARHDPDPASARAHQPAQPCQSDGRGLHLLYDRMASDGSDFVWLTGTRSRMTTTTPLPPTTPTRPGTPKPPLKMSPPAPLPRGWTGSVALSREATS